MIGHFAWNSRNDRIAACLGQETIDESHPFVSIFKAKLNKVDNFCINFAGAYCPGVDPMEHLASLLQCNILKIILSSSIISQ